MFNSYNILTKREREVFDCIVLNGLSKPEIADKLVLKVTTIYTHINSICNKLGYEGDTRLLQLIIDYYINVSKGVIRMRNCTECKFCKNATCSNQMSEYYGDKDKANKGQLCKEFEEKKEEK